MSACSSGPPTVTLASLLRSSSTKRSCTASTTKMRSTEMHACPQLASPPMIAARAARSRLASAQTMNASLPPSSSSTGIGRSAAAAITLRPVATEPVKNSMSTFAFVSAAPVLPSPCTISTTPAGSPSRWKKSAMTSPDSGVTSDGFKTTVLPPISAEITGNTDSWNGKFHGAMMPMTPRGKCSMYEVLPGIISGVPTLRRASSFGARFA
jgi:hypothetical protein